MGISVQERIMAERETIADEGEPIESFERSLNKRGGSLGHTVPKMARRVLDVDSDDDVLIEVYHDGYVVRPVPGESDGD